MVSLGVVFMCLSGSSASETILVTTLAVKAWALLSQGFESLQHERRPCWSIRSPLLLSGVVVERVVANRPRCQLTTNSVRSWLVIATARKPMFVLIDRSCVAVRPVHTACHLSAIGKARLMVAGIDWRTDWFPIPAQKHGFGAVMLAMQMAIARQ